MDCNKGEAAKAKEIAANKFFAKDYAGARRFALKARDLYPGLEGVQQMAAVIDVYVAAENKLFGKPDWYSILGVDPVAEEEAVRKQYRKLALLLHPDKNKSVGADGAFKLVSEAWSLLSDKLKRALYDHWRSMAMPPVEVSKAAAGTSSKRPALTACSNAAKQKKAKPNPPKRTPPPAAPSSTPKPKPKMKTFWTVCHRCQTQYEHMRFYVNHNLICPNCNEPFSAVEINPPCSFGCSKSSSRWSVNTTKW